MDDKCQTGKMRARARTDVPSGFEVIAPLGEGSLHARTWLARDQESGEKVVIKSLALSELADWKELELFERGASILQHLEHAQIPRVHAVIRDPDGTHLFWVQDFIDGVDLKRKIARDGPWTSERLEAFLFSMLDVLDYLHSFSPSIIHRDIKPSNIMLRTDGTYVLVDFDMLQVAVSTAVGGTTIVGTTGYAPPEQYLGRAEAASDIYALGATLLYLATGREPHEFPVERRQINLQMVSEELSPEIESIILRMMDPRPEQRPRSRAQILALLQPRDEVQTIAAALKAARCLASG